MKSMNYVVYCQKCGRSQSGPRVRLCLCGSLLFQTMPVMPVMRITSMVQSTVQWTKRDLAVLRELRISSE